MIYRKSFLSLFTLLFIFISMSFSFSHNLPPITQHPFCFTENRGQWDSHVLYKCNARNGMTWFLERDGITLLTMKEDRTKPPIVDPSERDLPEMMRRHPARYPMKSHALKFKFLETGVGVAVPRVLGSGKETFKGQNEFCPTEKIKAEAKNVEPSNELPWHNNYFLGNDSTKWAPNCRNYTNIVYRDVWEGIDIEWYEENGKLEFDFVVQPGADPSQIRMSCEGLTGEMSLDGFGIQDSGFGEKGKVEVTTSLPAHTVAPSDPRNDKSNTGKELLLPTSLGELRTALPQVYQISPCGTRSEVDAKFEIVNKNEFGITLPNGYEKEHTLRIDPLIYSMFLGGSGEDMGCSICSDDSGGVVVAGFTWSVNFPTTAGTIGPNQIGGHDCFATRLNSDGSQLLYSTYLGGWGDDYAEGLISDGSGGVYINGETTDTSYPHNHSFGPLGGQTDCFVTHLNNSGSQILNSVLFGGTGDDQTRGIDHDGSGGVIITGYTGSTNFPTTSNAYNTTNNGQNDCFVTRLNSTGSQIVYSTYIGGSMVEWGGGIINDGNGGAIVTGWTNSANFPTTSGAYDTVYTGGIENGDCFVTHLNSSGTQLIFSTLLGGSNLDVGNILISDGTGGVIVMGATKSTDFPVTSGTYDTIYSGGVYDDFITHINSLGSQLIYSTYLGGLGDDVGGMECMIGDGIGGVFVTGGTTSANFPTTNGAFNTSINGGRDCYIVHLDSSGTHLLYSTYVGGFGDDYGESLMRDTTGNVFVVGFTSSNNFPTTPGSFDTSFNGGGQYPYDCFVTKISLVSDTSSIVSERIEMPLEYALNQNFPNPFNSSTTIEFSLPKSCAVKLELFDLLGRRISTLVNTPQNAGVHHVRFDGKNFASGEYFYRLSTTNFTQTRKMILLK